LSILKYVGVVEIGNLKKILFCSKTKKCLHWHRITLLVEILLEAIELSDYV